MAAITTDDVKAYLRLDTTDEDTLIAALITTAKSYVTSATGKTYNDSELWNLTIKLLVAHWYVNRDNETSNSVNKISYSIDTLLHHIALCGDYS